ncbi:hypothetical protein [Haladaptatus sp. CMSO5]|uniref:hypothetical protein n=1 Tax=Haladaptatus sp. CMSO5 TaxID=3120514 RepID=UPI002FCDFD86
MKAPLVAALIVCSLLTPMAVVAQEDAFISVTGATTTPESPAVGDLVTVTATIRNSAGSQQAFEVRSVELVARTGNTEYDQVDNIGTISPGESLSVPLTTTFDEAGVKRLELEVRGRSVNGSSETVRYPVTIDVRSQEAAGTVPRVQILSETLVSNTESVVTVRVSNGGEATLRDLDLTLSGREITVEDNARVLPRLEPGTLTTFNFTVESQDPGRTAIDARLDYATASARRSVTTTRDVTIEPLNENVVVEASVVSLPETDTTATPPVSVEVLNLGNAAIESVVVTATVDGVPVARTLISEIDADSTSVARLNLSGVTDPADLVITASYDMGTVEGSSQTSLRYTPRVGVVSLTGINTEFEDGKLHITGSASNVGQGTAESVVVRVVPADGVTPAQPFKEYFVGTVPQSDFVVFDLYAVVSDNATAVPVSVTYLAGGEERSETVQVRIEDSQPATAPQDDGGFSLPLIIGGLFIVLLVVGVIGYAWRNSRNGTR